MLVVVGVLWIGSALIGAGEAAPSVALRLGEALPSIYPETFGVALLFAIAAATVVDRVRNDASRR